MSLFFFFGCSTHRLAHYVIGRESSNSNSTSWRSDFDDNLLLHKFYRKKVDVKTQRTSGAHITQSSRQALDTFTTRRTTFSYHPIPANEWKCALPFTINQIEQHQPECIPSPLFLFLSPAKKTETRIPAEISPSSIIIAHIKFTGAIQTQKMHYILMERKQQHTSARPNHVNRIVGRDFLADATSHTFSWHFQPKFVGWNEKMQRIF